MNIVSPYPLWYLIFCVALGAVLAFLLYRKDKKLVEFSKATIGVLFGLRFLCISLLAALLLSPLIKYFSKTVEKPIIVLAQDNSASMIMGRDSAFVKNELPQQLQQLKEELSKDFKVEHFAFSEGLQKVEDTASFNGRLSNFDVLFDDLSSRYANRNVGGVVLLSDGIYNEGSNPIYSAERLEYPIFSVPVGDTTKYVDARIQNVRSNKLAFLGNEFPVEIDIRFQESQEKKAIVFIRTDDQQVFSQEINLSGKNETVSVKALLRADKVGKRSYSVTVAKLPRERNILNNRRSFYIDVLDGRQKIALLAVSPHPDLAVIKRALSSNENYEVESNLLEDFTVSMDAYDLIILHQAGQVSPVLGSKFQDILDSNVPLFVVGSGWERLEKNFNLPTNKSRRVINNEAQGIVNAQFSLFTLEEEWVDQLQSFPPMNVSIGQVDGNANKTLLYQKLGSVATRYPLLSFYNTSADRKVGRLYGEGLWRWSMMSYVQNKSHQRFDRFVGKIVQFLAIKADRSFFRVNADNEVFENEAINLNAQLFNPSYELVNEEEVRLKLQDEESKEYDYTFSRRAKDYQLSIASLAPGSYSYTANVNYQGKQNTATGSFVVKALQLEKLNAEADYNLMYQLAAKSNGEVILPSELEQLVERFKSRGDITAVSYINEEVEDIINLKWIFFLLLALLSIEWLIRKRGGAY